MEPLKTALLQIAPCGTLEENLEKGIASCRKAKALGAELILVPNACPMEINRLSQLRARAYENMLAVATCNYPDSVPDCNGGSSVFDGMAHLPELTAPGTPASYRRTARKGSTSRSWIRGSYRK